MIDQLPFTPGPLMRLRVCFTSATCQVAPVWVSLWDWEAGTERSVARGGVRDGQRPRQTRTGHARTHAAPPQSPVWREGVAVGRPSIAPLHTPATETEARWHELLETSRPDPPKTEEELPSTAELGLRGTLAGNDSGIPGGTQVVVVAPPQAVRPGPRALATLMLRTGPGVRAEQSAPSRWPPQPQPQAQAGASSAPTATEVPGCAAVAAALYGRHSIWGNEIFAGQRFLER